MAVTSPQIILTFGDAELSSVTSSDAHAISTLANLANSDANRNLNYATFEPNGWLLDGSAKVYDHPQDVGFVSDDISTRLGAFSSPQELRITLDSVVDIEQGVTLEFNSFTGDYAQSVTIKYKDETDTLIASESHTPDGYNYFCEVGATREDVKYIDITFNETSEIYRHARLLGVYVDGVMWDKENIQTADIVEEIDPTSLTMPTNQVEFTLYSDNAGFSVVDPQGIYASLRENQRVDVYGFIDGARNYMGRFYLRDWDARSENIMSFVAKDAIFLSTGIKPTYYIGGEYIYVSSGGGSYAEVEAHLDLLLFFMLHYDIFERDVDENVSSNQITGYYEEGATLRDGFQQIGIGMMSYFTCARSYKIRVVKSVLAADVSTWDHVFTTSDIGENPKVTIKKLVAGVDLISHSYPLDGQHIDYQVYDGTISTGDYYFKIPRDYYGAASWVDTGTATITNTSVNVGYISFTVTVAGTLNMYLNESHAHNQELLTKRLAGLPAKTPKKILIIKDATMVTPYNASDVLDFVYNYNQQRYVCDFQVYAKNVAPGETVKVPVQGKYIWGIVERVETDLANGFSQKIRVVGDVHTNATT